MAAIEIDGLGMIYRSGFFGRREALRSLDLEIHENEIFGYLGANGAGKTTTIKILVGLMYPTSGSAKILGRDISDVEARRNIGYQPENPFFYEYLTASESLHFYGRLCGVPRAVRNKRVDELLELINVPGVRNMPVRQFSKGMRQRLGLAQALINDPKVLFLDEPLEGLDPMGRHQLREVITSLKEKGKTIFFSSHILSDVELICDRVGMLVRGELTAVGSLSSLLTSMLQYIEIAARDLPPDALAKIQPLAERLVTRDSVVHFRVPDEESGKSALRIISSSGATLLSYIPHRESLEEYFVRTSQQEDPKS